MNDKLHRRKIGGVSFLDGGRGDPFVLLHGIPGSSLTWHEVATQLADSFRVIVPDLQGFGESDSPVGDYYMQAQAVAIKQLLDTLRIRSLYLAGHDFGGPVAITLLRLFPELRLRGLVLSNTNVFTDTFVPLPLRSAKVPVLGSLVFKAMAGSRLGMRMIYGQAVANKKAFPWAKFKQSLSPRSIDFTRRIFQRSLSDLRGNYQPIQDYLGQVNAPSLIIWGEMDPFFAPSVGIRTQLALSGSILKRYASSGHFPPEECPNDFANDILERFAITPANIYCVRQQLNTQ